MDRIPYCDEKNRNICKSDIDWLDENGFEIRFWLRKKTIFTRYLANGMLGYDTIMPHLDEAVNNGRITDRQFNDVVDSHLLWQGTEHQSRLLIILVIGLSYSVSINDAKDTIRRANIVRSLGLQTFGVVVGKCWSDTALEYAKLECISYSQSGVYIDNASWKNACARWLMISK
ncbi:MAG: hypothetical protein AAF639_17615 [Chloroflexota bacterium]